MIEVSYLRDTTSQLLQVQLGGKLMRPHEILRDSRGMPRTNARTTVTGQVYIDANYNGAFDGQDRPVSDVEVWLDNGAMAVTDAHGGYRFDNVDPGIHNIRADLSKVPAGFVFAEAGTRTITIFPNRENRVEMRVIQTGRIEGRITYLNYTEDPDHPKESPLPDAHVLATGDGDTYSESNGSFLLGDLAPGRYEVRIDPASIPKGYVSQPASYIVTVTPGAVSQQPRFRLVIPPKPVIEIKAPGQKIGMPQGDKPPQGKPPEMQEN
jgi:hypothetical protein